MKLRIKGDSLRLRLQRGEVIELVEKGAVRETVHFAPGRSFVYSLVRDDVGAKIGAELYEREIEIRVPRALAERWHSSEEVGLSAEQPNAANGLRILIEKDFACLKPRADEDEADNFEHPLATDPIQASRC